MVIDTNGGTRPLRAAEHSVFDDDLREANGRLLVAGLQAQRDAEDSDRDLAQMNALIAGLAEGVVVFNARGDVVLLNPAARHIMGLPSGQLADDCLRTLRTSRLNGTTLPFAEGPAARACDGEVFSEEEVIISDGEYERRVVFSANSLGDGQGKVLRAILTCRDVTHLRELEKLREEHLALISHDLRSPLAIVLGAARQLAAAQDLTGIGQRAEMVGLIETSAGRIIAMADELLESAYLESGQFRLEKEPIALVPLVAAVLNRLVTPDSRPIRMVGMRHVEVLMGDGLRVERVLVNLVTNAMKYSAAGSPIEVRVQPGSGEVVVSILDEGRGISAHDLPYIFERFQRVGDTKGAPRSFGLGLYISRLIVEAHGGRIWAESTIGVGSTFSFTLPTENAAELTAED